MPVASSIEYPFADLPAPGTAVEVARGVFWIRMRLPFELDHINLWLLEDDGGWTIIDCGKARLAELLAACADAPRCAADVLEVLFRRRLETNQIFFAMGEAIAHLHFLHYAGQLTRTIGADGIARFRRAAAGAHR